MTTAMIEINLSNDVRIHFQQNTLKKKHKALTSQNQLCQRSQPCECPRRDRRDLVDCTAKQTKRAQLHQQNENSFI